MSQTPLVSTIIPTYNRAHLVGHAIRSALEQDYVRHEVIVVDDGSTDDTCAVLAQAFGDSIRYVRQENAGPAAARNTGIRAARGEYIAFLDSDDLWLPGKLTAQVEALQRQPGYAFSYGKAIVATPDGAATEKVYGGSDRGRTGDSYAVLLRHHAVLTPTLMVRASVFPEIGHFDETLVTAEDTDLFIRLTATTGGVYISEALASVRQHEGRMTLTDRASGVQAKCASRVYARAWDTLPACHEPLRGLIAGRLATIALRVAAHERGSPLDHHSMMEIIESHPDWFAYPQTLWHVADWLVRTEPESPGEIDAMVTEMLRRGRGSCSARAQASVLLNAAVRRGIRRGLPLRAACWAARYLRLMPHAAIACIFRRD